LTVRVHIILPEQHRPNTLYWGRVFTPATIFATLVLVWHSMLAVETVATPYIPVDMVVRFRYIMNMAGRFLHIAIGYILTMIRMV